MNRFESAGWAAISAAIFLVNCASARAGDFDGSKPLLCATMEGHACDPGLACERALPAELGAPRFLSIDFTKKLISGPNRATPIVTMNKAQGQILMEGTELDYAWTVVLDTSDGDITVTLTNRHDALVLFGDCTAM